MRECLKDYIHDYVQNRSIRSKNAPIDINRLPDFDREKFKKIMDKKYKQSEVIHEEVLDEG